MADMTSDGGMDALPGARAASRFRFLSALPLSVSSLTLGTALVLLRGRPSLEADTGVYMSVARLLDRGDRLYVNVIDNKEPLFYYSHAVALAAVGWEGPFLLDALWLAVAGAGIALLLRALGLPHRAIVIGFVAYPALLAGQWYLAGYSMLGSLALIPLAGLLWTREKPILCGIVMATGALLQIDTILLLLSLPLVLSAMDQPGGRRRAQAAGATAAFVATFALAAALLALTGELGGYLRNFKRNLAYSDNVLAARGLRGGVPGHIRVAITSIGPPLRYTVVALIFLSVSVLAVMVLTGRTRMRTSGPPRTAAALLVGAVLTATVTLALTAVWLQHDQMLAYPATLVAVFLSVVIPLRSGIGRSARWLVPIVAAAVIGAAWKPGNGHGGASWWKPAHSEAAILVKQAAAYGHHPQGTFTMAHLGQNDEEGFVAFLPARYQLSCPEIDQYPFTPAPQVTLKCVRSARPEIILVTPNFRQIATAPAAWNAFVSAGWSLLRLDYRLAASGPGYAGTTQVWVLRAPGRTPGSAT